MEQLILDSLKYICISAGIVLFSFLLRDFMVNHFPMRLRRGLTSMQVPDLLEIAEELEVPVEKGNTPSSEQWLKMARQSPLKTALVIRLWLQEDGRSSVNSVKSM